MSFCFTPANEDTFNLLLPRYPHPKSLLLPCLWMVQYQQGYISMEAIAYLCDRLELPKAHIYSVASFYTMFRLEPCPPYHIQVCRTLSCALCGQSEILQAIEEETGLRINEQNEHFKLTQVECLGACGGAPMLALNETYHENLTPASTKELLKRCLS